MAGESFVWLFTVPAFGEEGVPGITIAQGQPEAVHEIIIGAKRRKFFRTGKYPTRTYLTHAVRLALAGVLLKSRTKRIRERRACAFFLQDVPRENKRAGYILVQWCRNNGEYSARYFCQRKAEEGGDAGASLTDDNAVMAEIAGAVFTVISAMLY